MSLTKFITIFLLVILGNIAFAQTPPPSPPPDGGSTDGPAICDPQLVSNCPPGSIPPPAPGGDPDGGGLPDGGIPPIDQIPVECQVPAGQIPDPFCMGTPHDESDHNPPGDLTGFPSGKNFDDFEFDDFFTSFKPDDFSNFNADTLAQFKPDFAAGLNADYLAKLSPEAMTGFSADLLKNLSPDALAGFNASQISSLAPDVIGEFSPEKLEKLLPEAFVGFNKDQVKKLSPDALTGMSPDQLKSLNKDAIAGLTADQVKQLKPTSLTGLTPEQFANFDQAALGALKPSQLQSMPDTIFSGLDHDHLGSFDPDSIKVLGAGILKSVNPDEFKKMDDSSFSKMMANFDPTQFKTDDFQNLVPEGWKLDTTTGELTPPVGAKLNFRSLDNLDTDSVDLPTLPDFSTSLGLGGKGGKPVLTELDEALSAANLPMFNFSQENGILKVKGTGAKEGTNLSFIPDSNNIYKAVEGATPGLSLDETGKYVLTTPSGYRVPVISALNNPQQLLESDPNLQSLQIKDTGEAKIALKTGGSIASVATPTLKPSTLPPGVHTEGTGRNKTVTVVYADGTEQSLKPAIQDRDDFVTAASAFPAVKDIQMNADGTIKIMYNGVPLTLQPEFDVEAGSGTTTTPGIVPIDAKTFLFTNSKGEKQKFYIN